MPRISPAFLIASIVVWVFGFVEMFETNSTISTILIHGATLGYLAGIVVWAKNRKHNTDPPVTFWKKADPNVDTSGCLSRVFKLGIFVNLALFTPFLVASNWFPYQITRTKQDWENIEYKVTDQLQLKSTLGHSIHFQNIETNHDDSITTRRYRVTGKYGAGLIDLSVNDNDSIVSLQYEPILRD
ncbi:MAG: hypothetical protein RIC35_11265 [Marinoscillum sp.]